MVAAAGSVEESPSAGSVAVASGPSLIPNPPTGPPPSPLPPRVRVRVRVELRLLLLVVAPVGREVICGNRVVRDAVVVRVRVPVPVPVLVLLLLPIRVVVVIEVRERLLVVVVVGRGSCEVRVEVRDRELVAVRVEFRDRELVAVRVEVVVVGRGGWGPRLVVAVRDWVEVRELKEALTGGGGRGPPVPVEGGGG